MSFRNAYGIYQVLKELLEVSTTPLTCVDLFDHPNVKQFADDANRVSDYLGHMYRRGLLSRYPAPRTENSAARFAYLWKSAKKEAPKSRVAAPRLEVYTNERRVSRSNIGVTENGDGSVTIELANLTITVKPK